MTKSGLRWVSAIAVMTVGMVGCGGSSSSSSTSSTGGYTVGGNISGLNTTGLVLGNGKDSLDVSSGATGFTFPNGGATGATYAVTVLQQPVGQSCLIYNSSGTIDGADVDTVGISCGLWDYDYGTETTDAAAVYNGTGACAATSTPGGRSGAMSWTDSSHNFWLFGGTPDGTNDFSDLWIYYKNVSSGCQGDWVWISGADTMNTAGNYVAEGSFSNVSAPGARTGGITWVTTSNSQNYLWLFGGQSGNGQFNDLWVFNPLTYEWEWIGGSSSTGAAGVYSTVGGQGTPGARTGAVSWLDSSGNLWLFGGQVTSGGSTVQFNDLWKCACSPSSSPVWTWVSGSNGDTTPNASGSYGTIGVSASTNVPGARANAVSWVDSNGNLWLFGGWGVPSSPGAAGDLNDLWRFNPTTSQWTWMGGASTTGAASDYGTQGVLAASTGPGARDSSSAWVDTLGNLWLFGGQSTAGGVTAYYGDIWYYTPPASGATGTGEWAWASGLSSTDYAGVYGTEGTSAVANHPGARSAAASWVDGFGDQWLYGGVGNTGTGNVSYGDLWEYLSAQ